MADRKKITLHRGILGVKYSYMCGGAERGNNMKVLIFADSHGYNMAMAFAVDREEPDAVIPGYADLPCAGQQRF